MSAANKNVYDIVLYPSFVHPQTHPDRLATLATLFGLNPAPIANCRVLELGAGNGSNIIPFAYGLPDADFLGIDLAEVPVRDGKRFISEMGLKNIDLKALDLLDLDDSFGKFDYIIAHGLYSWVPPMVQDKLLAVCSANLKPNGLAYISYNTYPGCHLRDMLRGMLKFHTRALTDPLEKVEQSLAFLSFLSKSYDQDDGYRTFIKAEFDLLQERRAVLIHDDLADFNQPVYFHQFVTHAGKHGLKFVSEANFQDMQDYGFPDAVRQTLANMDDDPISRAQYLDFVACRRFRQSILCHDDQPALQHPRADAIKALFVSSAAESTAERPDITSTAVEEIRGPKGSRLETGHPIAKALIAQLNSRWPNAQPFADVVAGVRSLLASSPARDHTLAENFETELSGLLLETYKAGLVQLRTYEPAFAARPSERPRASKLALYQVSLGQLATTLLFDNFNIEDALGKQLVLLLDGTRTHADLLAALREFVASGALGNAGMTQEQSLALSEQLPELLNRNLDHLARIGLLEA